MNSVRAVHESEKKLEKPLNEEQQENQDLLIKCITPQDLGFSGGKPVAACVIYKCLLHWKSFEVESTSVFDRIIQTIVSSIEDADNNDVLAYWLCNTSTLLMLLDDLRQVEAKYPALLFNLQLSCFLEKIYGMIRNNLEKEVSPWIWQCLKARLSDPARQAARIAPWQSIVEILDKYLNTMKANYVPAFLVRKVFAQTLSFMNVQLFNNLLLTQRFSLSDFEYAKSGLAELEEWCCLATEDYVGSAWDELKDIRQAVGFMLQVIHEEPEKTLVDVYYELCPELSIRQIYRISTMFWDDKDGTHSVPPHIMSSMRDVIKEEYTDNGSPFLLDIDKSIPFSIDDLSKSMPTVEAANVEPPPLIRENSGFMFLCINARIDDTNKEELKAVV